MPASCVIDSAGLLLRLEDRHAHSEERDALTRALADPRLAWPVRILVDARRSLANPDGDAIAERARCLARMVGGALTRCALLVSTPLQYGLARMFAAYAIHRSVKVAIFQDESAARAWLSQAETQSDLTDAAPEARPDAPIPDEGLTRLAAPAALSAAREPGALRNHPDELLPSVPTGGRRSGG
jgi:hypothetical protein